MFPNYYNITCSESNALPSLNIRVILIMKLTPFYIAACLSKKQQHKQINLGRAPETERSFRVN